jgi:glutamate-1-semialdehyde 2,1-aminomutase
MDSRAGSTGLPIQLVKVSSARQLSLDRSQDRIQVRVADPVERTESHAATDGELEDYLNVKLAYRGILMTPFHNMALMSPATTESDVDRHHEIFSEAVAELVGA